MLERDEWSRRLQEILQKNIYSYVQHTWRLSDLYSDKGFTADLWDTAEVVDDLEILDIDRTQQKLIVFVQVGQTITTNTEAKYLVHRLLSLVSEDFLVITELHDESALRFWFITGTSTHGHEGVIILKREDHPHILYW